MSKFKKGHKINLGKKNRFGHRHSEETKILMRKKQLGKKMSLEMKEKMRLLRKGKTLSKETREKIGNSLRGKYRTRPKCVICNKYLSNYKAKRCNLHKGKKGKDCHFWKGGVTLESKIIRGSLEYRLWRKAVFERDNFTCIWCGKRGGNIEADHIKPFAFFPELRFAIDNGRTLCKNCHRKTNTYGMYIIKTTKEFYEPYKPV